MTCLVVITILFLSVQIYLKALTLHEDCQATDALSFLKEEFDRMRPGNAPRANVDLELVAIFDGKVEELQRVVNLGANFKILSSTDVICFVNPYSLA